MREKLLNEIELFLKDLKLSGLPEEVELELIHDFAIAIWPDYKGLGITVEQIENMTLNEYFKNV